MVNAEINKCKNYLLNNIKLHNDYDAASGLKRPYLMVEGKTDEAFITRVLIPEARCLPVVEFMRAKNAFSTSPPPKVNYKDVITTILKQISFFPDVFDFPSGAEKWPLYGLVDNDFGTERDFTRVTNLFFTDTHDIETLMLSTDLMILTRLSSCSISEDETKRAVYLATQLAAFRKEIADDDVFNIRSINGPDGTVDFSAFTEGDRINLFRFTEHVNNNTNPPISKEKLKRQQAKIMSRMKKHLDKEGMWKKSYTVFEMPKDDPLWMEINGHDVLSAIKYINETAKKAFSNISGYAFDRTFEFALSKAYNYETFRSTRLYNKLLGKGLILEEE